MADSNKYFKVRVYPRGANDWTPIVVPPGEFSRVVIENQDLTTDATFRTDVVDSSTQKTIPMGQELDIFSHVATFKEGDIVGYFNLTTATAPCASFTR